MQRNLILPFIGYSAGPAQILLELEESFGQLGNDEIHATIALDFCGWWEVKSSPLWFIDNKRWVLAILLFGEHLEAADGIHERLLPNWIH